MSVVVRDPRDGRIKLLMKGADVAVKERLSKRQRVNLDMELERCSKVGLRTLLVGMRIISEKEYEEFRASVRDLPLERTTNRSEWR